MLEIGGEGESKPRARDDLAIVLQPELRGGHPAIRQIAAETTSLDLAQIGSEIPQGQRVAAITDTLEITRHFQKGRLPLC